MDDRKEDHYIATLKYGKEKLEKGEGVTRAEFINDMENRGYNSEKYKTGDTFTEIFKINVGMHNHSTRFLMGMEAYFNLLEYEELKEARQSSKTATYFAFTAICISIITLGVSIYFSNKQLQSPTVLDKNQFNKIQTLIERKTNKDLR